MFHSVLADADDFDPDSGFQTKPADDRWAGEDEHLDKVKVQTRAAFRYVTVC